jgi:type IV fimbrial biogenesis protein FimT
MSCPALLRQRAVCRHDDAGFTLMELVVAMVFAGVLLALAIPSWRSYQQKQGYLADTQQVVSTLRDVQIRAVAEETKFEVDFGADGKTMSISRWNGSGYAPDSTVVLQDSSGAFGAHSFTKREDGSTTPSAFFYPRGTASTGHLTMTRMQGSGGPTYVVSIEGLTGRVTYS